MWIGYEAGMPTAIVLANGKETQVVVPCKLDKFLEQQGLLPKSVVVELNEIAVAPSEFSEKEVTDGDRLEIVRIVAGG